MARSSHATWAWPNLNTNNNVVSNALFFIAFDKIRRFHENDILALDLLQESHTSLHTCIYTYEVCTVQKCTPMISDYACMQIATAHCIAMVWSFNPDWIVYSHWTAHCDVISMGWSVHVVVVINERARNKCRHCWAQLRDLKRQVPRAVKP